MTTDPARGASDARLLTPPDARSLTAPDARSLLTAAEACALLDVKRPTLYSYVSRGQIRTVHEAGARRRLYLADDVRRVAARSAARRGHAPVAAGALRWGEPVLDTSVCAVGEPGFLYRGEPVLGLVERGVPFERVADLLWQAPDGEPWPAGRARQAFSPSPGRPLARLIELVAWRSARAPEATSGEAGRVEARELLALSAAVLCPDPSRHHGPLARRLAANAGLPPGAARALDAVLVLACDHELNASTFAARVAASTGATLTACVGAALYVFSGPRHGGACDRVEELVDALPSRPGPLRVALRERLAAGALPEFGHRLYPDGDPRSAPLLGLAVEHVVAPEALARMRQVTDTMAELTGLLPSLDYALVTLTRALGLPPRAASGLFALGRMAGWIAHVFEQRESGALLRPRARYVGPGARPPRD